MHPDEKTSVRKARATGKSPARSISAKDDAAGRAAPRGIFGEQAELGATRVGDLYFLRQDRYIGRSLAEYGEWAQLEIDRLLAYIRPGDFVLDVGANVGFHAISFARKVGYSGQVWAFEPDPVNALLLRLNVINAGMERTVVPFDVAVSDRHALCRFRSYAIGNPENFGHTAVDDDDGHYARIATALDSLAFDRPPALIKVDIEGHEMPALEGMRGLIDSCAPVLSVEADSPQAADAIADYLADLGYDVHDFVTDAFNPRNFAGRTEDIWGGNGRCENLLCVVPGLHVSPLDLPLRKRAAYDRASQGPRGFALVTAERTGIALAQASAMPGAVPALRSDIRKFTSGFLRAGLGRLDPEHYGEVVKHALDYISAEAPQSEAQALRRMLVSGVEAVGRALTRKDEDAARLAATAELVKTHEASLASLEERARNEVQALSDELADAHRQLDLAVSRLIEAEDKLAAAKAAAAGSREAELAAVAASEASQREVLRLEQANALLGGELKEAQGALDNLWDQRAAQAGALAEAEARAQQLKGAAEAGAVAQQALTRLEGELAGAKAAMDEIEADSARLRSELEAQAHAGVEWRDATVRLEGELAAAQAALSARDGEVSRLREELEAAQAAVVRMADDRANTLAEAEARVVRLEGEVEIGARAQASLARLEGDLATAEASLRMRNDEMDLLRGELQAALAVAAARHGELAATTQALAQVRAELDAVRTRAEEGGDLQQELARMEARIAAQSVEIKRLRALG